MSNTSITYKRSLIIRAAGVGLGIAARVLPQPIYKLLYSTAFNGYRCLLRMLYLRHWVVYKLTNQQEQATKVQLIHRIMPYSLVGVGGLSATYDVVYEVETAGTPGAVVECGVAQGGSAALMALVSARSGGHRRIWLFDSFEGLPKPTSNDFVEGSTGIHIRPLPKGSCLGTYEEVEELLFSKLRLDRNDIRLVKGWFQDTLPEYRDKIGAVSVLRIDGDWYESTKCCLDNLYDNVVEGGYVIVDDYGNCFGARKATDKFLAARGLSVELVFDGRGGCHFIKPC